MLKVTVDDSWLDSVDVNAIPVQVIGRMKMRGSFPILQPPKSSFPNLTRIEAQAGLRPAMRGGVMDAPALRFETWAAYYVFSS